MYMYIAIKDDAVKNWVMVPTAVLLSQIKENKKEGLLRREKKTQYI
jgi:hypothetical protein